MSIFFIEDIFVFKILVHKWLMYIVLPLFHKISRPTMYIYIRVLQESSRLINMIWLDVAFNEFKS